MRTGLALIEGSDYLGIDKNPLISITMKAGLLIILFVSIALQICTASAVLDSLKQKYFDELSRSEKSASLVLLEIGKTGDTDAIPFLNELYMIPPESRGGYIAKFPEIKFADTIAGMAQVALATLGDEEAWSNLIEQSFHNDELVRFDALRKIRLIYSDRAIEALSNFIGDANNEGEYFGNVEWSALFELTSRLKNPPFPVKNFKDLHPGYYSEGGKEKWLRWRMDHFGIIKGREAIFEEFLNSSSSGAKKLNSPILKNSR